MKTLGYAQTLALATLFWSAAARAEYRIHIETTFSGVVGHALTCPHHPDGTFTAVIDTAPGDHDEWVIDRKEYKWEIAPTDGPAFDPDNLESVELSLADSQCGKSYTVTVTVTWTERNTETGEENPIVATASTVFDAVRLEKFEIVADYPQATTLVDNRTATATITVLGSSDPSLLSFSFKSQPTGLPPLNKKGTAIHFSPTQNPLVWKTSPTYWYGVSPDKCCYTNRFPYRISLTMNTCCGFEKDCEVNWPDDPTNATKTFVTSQSVVHTPEPIIIEGETKYRCLIEFCDFRKAAARMGDPSNQYAEEIIKEEEYHAMQFKGLVPESEGGQVDCWTAKGLKFQLNLFDDSPCYRYGNTAEEALTAAEETLNKATGLEQDMSQAIWDNDLPFCEVKAKTFAGFNAAFKYHCTYERTYGPAANQRNNHHPAYAQ